MTKVTENTDGKLALSLKLESAGDRLLAGEFDLAIDYHRLAFAFASKSAKTYRAALRLVENGLGEPALILLRSILEDLIHLSYISRDPERRSRLFLGFAHLEKKQALDYLSRVARVNKRYAKTLEELRELWKRDFKRAYLDVVADYPKKRHWAGKTLWEMAGTDPKLVEYYCTLYLYASGFVHGGSVLALESYVRPTESQKLQSLAHPSEAELATALELGFPLFLKCLLLFGSACRLDVAELDLLAEEGRRLFAWGLDVE
jgi:hypothetical protein